MKRKHFKTGENRKLSSRRSCPWIVIEKLPNGVNFRVVNDSTKALKVVHHDRLSPVKSNHQQYTSMVPKQKSYETIDCYSDTTNTVTESVFSDDDSIVSNAANQEIEEYLGSEHASLCSCVAVLMCRCSHVSLFSCVAVLMCRCSHVSLFSCVAVLMCHCSHVSLFSCVAVLMCRCSHVSLFSCVAVLMCRCSHVSLFSCVCVLMCLCAHVSVCSCVCVFLCLCSCVSVLMCRCAHMSFCSYVSLLMCLCLCVCAYASLVMCMSLCVSMLLCTWVYFCVRRYVRVCMRIHIYTLVY